MTLFLQERHTKHKHHRYAGNEIDDGEDENQIDDEFGDNNDNGFETSCEDGENVVDDDNEEENEEDEEDDENDQESEEEDINDQENKEDKVLVEGTKIKSPPPKTIGK